MTTITSPRTQSPASTLRNASPQIPQSPTGTPTSSVRPSLDVPNPQNGTTSPAAPAQTQTHRRNRDALRDYYNLKTRPQPERGSLSRTSSIASTSTVHTTTQEAPPGTPTSTTALPPSIDSPTFDADAYVQHLLKTSSLQTLLRTEATLISEIKHLDGERKALVYDNYSKLIGATRMIGQMQRVMNDGVDSAGTGIGARMGFTIGNPAARGVEDVREKVGLKEVERVKGMVENIGRIAGDLRSSQPSGHGVNAGDASSSPAEKRALVRWVLQAPDRFERLQEEDDVDEIRRQWRQLCPVLDQWEGVKGVAEVRLRCQEVLDSVAVDANGQTNGEEGEG